MSRRTWWIIVAAWLGIGLADAARILLTRPAFAPDLDLQAALEWTIPDALIWVLLTPIPVVLARRFPIRRPRVLRDLAVHVPVAVVVGVSHVLLDVVQNLGFDVLAGRSVDFVRTFGYIAPYNTHLMILTYFVIVGVTRFVDDQVRLRDASARTAALQQQLAEARLHSLQERLRPHFLFNALHTGSALIGRDPEGARTLLRGLGDLLRASLSLDERLRVPLRDELEIVRTYLDIERARFGERLKVEIDVDDTLLDTDVPPFLLQPLVENAIRHGLGPRREGGSVRIRIRDEADALRIVVADDGVGVAADAVDGTGLTTTRSRLEAMYGTDARLTLGPGPEGGTQVDVVIPRHANEPHGSEAALAHRDRG